MDTVRFFCIGVLLCYLGTVWLLEWPLKTYWSKKAGPALEEQVKLRGASVVREELKVSEAPRMWVRILKTIGGAVAWLLALVVVVSLPAMLGVAMSLVLAGVDGSVRRRNWKQEWLRNFVRGR